MMGKKHQWAEFYSPRNGRICIQACQTCGVAKSMALNIECLAVPKEKRKSRLRGWSMNKSNQSAVVAYQIR